MKPDLRYAKKFTKPNTRILKSPLTANAKDKNKGFSFFLMIINKLTAPLICLP